MSFAQEASSVLDQLLGDIRSKFADSQHQQGVLDAFRAFAAAVNWRVGQPFYTLSYTEFPCVSQPANLAWQV